MFKVATAKEMQQVDRITINKYGIAGAVLMERAGLAVAEKIKTLFLQGIGHRAQGIGKSGIKNVIILCGGGNNGGGTGGGDGGAGGEGGIGGGGVHKAESPAKSKLLPMHPLDVELTE